MILPVWKPKLWSRIEFVRDPKALRWVLAAAVTGCLLLLFLSGIYWDILWLLFG